MRPYKDSGTNNDSDQGNCLTKNFTGKIVRLSWKFMNQLRLVGPLTEDLKGMLPTRYGPEDNDFGPFFMQAPIFRGGSTRNVTFFTGIKDPEDDTAFLNIKLHQPPICRFFERVKKMSYGDTPEALAIKQALLTGGPGRAAPLADPSKSHGLVQGIQFRQDRDNPSRIEPIVNCLFILTTSARSALEAKLNEKVDNYTGDSGDLTAQFVAGDIVNADTGALIKIYNSGIDQQAAGAGQQEQQVDWSKAQAGSSGGDNQVSKYICEVGNPLPLERLQDGRIKLAVEGTLFTPWNECLNFLTEREQFDLVVQAFEDYPKILCQVFSDKLDWMPENVKRNTETMHTQAGTLAVPPDTAYNMTPGAALPGVGTGAQVPGNTPPTVDAGVAVPSSVAPAIPHVTAPVNGVQVPEATPELTTPTATPPIPQPQTVDGAVIDWGGAKNTPAPGVTEAMSPEAFAQVSTEGASAASPAEATPAQPAPAGDNGQTVAAAPAAGPTTPVTHPSQDDSGTVLSSDQPRVDAAMAKLEEIRATQATQ